MARKFPIQIARRTALAGLLASLSPLALGGCIRGPVRDPAIWARATIDPLAPGTFFDAYQMSVLSDVTAFVLPVPPAATDRDAGTTAYLDGLMIGWATALSRQRVLNVIDTIEAHAQSHYGQPYVTLAEGQRRAVVEQVDAAAFGDDRHVALASPAHEAWLYYKALAFDLFDSSAAATFTYSRIPGFYDGDMSREEYVAALRANAENFSRFVP